jgi:hypothetical protein
LKISNTANSDDDKNQCSEIIGSYSVGSDTVFNHLLAGIGLADAKPAIIIIKVKPNACGENVNN